MSDHESDLQERLQRRRRELVDYFSAIPADAHPLTLQEALADEIRKSEAEDKDLDTWRRHRDLVRIIGDGIAFMLLHDHTIRTLGRHPGGRAAAALLAQKDDFDFVLEVAKKLADSGYIPILNDVTNLLRVGDIVAINQEHVLVLECKNSPLPSRYPPLGRRGRQDKRGDDAAEYLRASQILEPEGTRVATSIELPTPEWPFLQALSESLQPNQEGYSVGLLSEGDGVGLATVDTGLKSLESALTELTRLMSADETAVVASSVDSIMNPLWSRPSPLIFPIDPWLRSAILETAVVMIRVVDVTRFNATERLASGDVAVLDARLRKGGGLILSVTIGSNRHEIGSGLTDRVIYWPRRFASLKDAILANLGNVVAMERQVGLRSTRSNNSESRPGESKEAVQLAAGDDVMYGAVYRGDYPGEHLVVYGVAPQNHDDISHVVWNIAKQEYSAFFRRGVRIDLDDEALREIKERALRRKVPPAS